MQLTIGHVIITGLLAATASAQTGWKDLTGQPVPAIKVRNWLNTGAEQPTSASLKGKVWLLEFFATW